MKRPLILNGFMATGKTTIGRLVAQAARVDFLDLDAAIEQDAGCSIAQLFARDGESAFRRREREILERLLSDPTPRVIAVGGGALIERGIRLQALEHSVLVTLETDLETAISRATEDGAIRPLLSGDRSQAELLLSLRAPAYAEAHHRVPVRDRSPTQLCDQVVELWQRDSIGVAAGDSSYSVEIGRGIIQPRLAEHLGPASSGLLITDDTVDSLYGDVARAAFKAAGQAPHTFRLTPGEQHKHPDSLRQIWDQCLEAGMDRRSIFVGLGGGVATDVAGFAAATWMRGVRWISAPTTLLGMVDASVGGKTAVDLPGAKNVVGAFWQPTAVVCDVDVLRSEPRRGFVSALAEVVKTALIGDQELFELLEREPERTTTEDQDFVAEMVRRCIRVKARIVSQDEREGGLRASLNLGHTIGHAIEAQAGYGTLTHGEAVSLGLVAAVRVGRHLGKTSQELAARVEQLLRQLGLPVDLSKCALDAAANLLANDKKRGGDKVRFVLTTEPGTIEFQHIELGQLQAITRDLA